MYLKNCNFVTIRVEEFIEKDVNKRKRPPQIENLHAQILECIEREMYIQSTHAIKREDERAIALPDVLYVLKTGRHEKSKTEFDEEFNKWKYAIRGSTLEGFDIRIIIAFERNDMLIITVMHVYKIGLKNE